jgi:flagellar biosynthesis chaperone FliJ
VLDVSFQERHVSSENSINNEKAKLISQEIKELEIKLEKLNMKRERIQKQMNLVNEYANKLSRPLAKPDDKEKASTDIETFMNFLGTYEIRTEQLDNELFTTKKDIEGATEALNAARNNLGSIGVGSYQRIL